MTSILAVFFLALTVSLLVTPLTGKLGKMLGAIDMPNQRKVHNRPIPRTGGPAIVIAFLGSLALARLFTTEVTRELLLDRQNLMLLAGGMMVFMAGLVDDFRHGRNYASRLSAAPSGIWPGSKYGVTFGDGAPAPLISGQSLTGSRFSGFCFSLTR